MRLVGLLLAGASLVAIPDTARACGGFFCNQPQQPADLPVAQTGENVLFAMDPLPSGQHRLEAHIQIFYTGPADRFSWVVPVDAAPTLDIGSNAVFAVLDAATRPKLMVTRSREGTCSDDQRSFESANGSAKADAGTGAGSGGGGVEVSFRGNIGPFDAVVVKADEPGRLKAWLAENMYYLSDEGSRLIDAYVLEQKYFVALKLLPGKGVDEIQPIVLRFEGPGPCVPLRLTAVASLPDLRVNLWVLAGRRVVPENYYEITINETKLDWLGGGQNYQDLLKSAANEAGGNAFAVEYVGTPSLVGPFLRPGFTAAALDGVTSLAAAQQALSLFGLQGDAEINQVLQGYFEGNQFPGMTLSAVLEARIVKPRRDAEALFRSHQKLTRLVTFISPEEMKLDPTFIESFTLPDVSNVRTAQAFLQCGAREYSSCTAPMRVDLADGRRIFYKAPAAGWCMQPTPDDRGVLDQMPSLERGWKREATGEGVVRFDNTAAIAAKLAEQERRVVTSDCSCALGGRAAAPPLVTLAALALLVLRRRRR